MNSFKTTLVVGVLFFSCMFFSSCPEPAPWYWNLQFSNNSTDTIGMAIFEHKRFCQNDSFVCIQEEYPIIPSRTISTWISYDGDGSSGGDHDWNNYFNKSNIDTLVIVAHNNTTYYQYGKKYKLQGDNNILKTYKYHEGNADLTHMIFPTITYP